jgi:RNA polymerase sigma factor (sigma-70 family)
MNVESLYYQEIRTYKRLSPDEENALFARLYAGDLSARECLIQSYLRLVVDIARHPKFTRLAERMDLIQEGNIGLIQAIDSYDPDSVCTFLAFARTCIRNRILSFIQQSSKVLYILDTPVFEDSEEYITRADMVADEPTVLGDASFTMAEEVLMQAECRSHVLQALETLPRREREVIQLLYGVGVRDAMSLQEVAMLLGVTKERVGQIRNKALLRL